MSRLFRTSATSITLWTAILTVQAQTLLDLKSQGRNVDFSGAVATKPFRVGTTLPAVCNVGEAFFKSDAPPGSNLYTCTATNTWTPQSGSGGSASLPSTTNLVKGNGSGGAAIASPGADYYKPGMSISSMDLPPNVATTDGQNTYSAPGNQYFGKYDVACDATGVSADNVLVKKSGAVCVALTTSDTGIGSGLVGLLVSGSTTANGRVRKLGVGDCSAVGSISAGDWIKPSTTTAGYCEGSSSRPTAGTVIIGRANGPSGATVPVDIMIDPNNAGGSSVTLKTNGTNNGSQSTLNLAAGSNVTLTDNGTGTVTIASSGSGGSGAGAIANHGNQTFPVPANPTPATMWTDTTPAIPANTCIRLEGYFRNTTLNNNIVVTATYGSASFVIFDTMVDGANAWVTSFLCSDATQANVRFVKVHLHGGSGSDSPFGVAYDAESTVAESTTSAKSLIISAVDSGGGDILLGSLMVTDGGRTTGGGDVSTNTSTSVDGEVALFSGTGGKALKRATGTGIPRLASGVQSVAELSGDATTSGSNAVTLAMKFKAVKLGAYEVGAENGSSPLVTADLTGHAFIVNGANAKTLTEASCVSDAGDQPVTVKIGATTLFTIHCVAAGSYNASTTDGTTGYISAAGMASTTVGAHAMLDLSGTANTTTKDIKLHIYGTIN